MDLKTVENYILSMPGAARSNPFGEKVAVYTVGGEGEVDAAVEDMMFALIPEGTDPIRLSLKCDPQLSKLLREKYETVMPGERLNKKYWNTIILSGQLEWEEVKDLIRLSYNLVADR